MNPVGEAGNMFSSLFDRVPAKRAGNQEDIAGAVIYLISRAGVRLELELRLALHLLLPAYLTDYLTGLCRWRLCLYRWRPRARRQRAGVTLLLLLLSCGDRFDSLFP